MNKQDAKLDQEDEFKISRTTTIAGARRRKNQVKKASKPKPTSKPTLDRKVFPDAMSIPVVKRDHGYASSLVDSALQNVKILTRPEKTFYLVDIQAMLELFALFEACIRTLHRPGGWPHNGYFTGLFMRCFAARLQRVATFTDHAVFNQRELIRVPGDIPIIVAHCINQFGVKLDAHNQVTIAPYVTFEVIAAILRLSTDLLRGPAPGAAPGVGAFAVIKNPDNWASWIEIGYGAIPNINVVCGCAFRSLSIPYTPAPTMPQCEMNATASADIYNNRNAIARMTGVEHIAVSGNPSPLFANIAVGGGGGVLGAIGGVDPVVTGAIDEQTDAFSSAGDPFSGVAPPAGSVAMFRTAPSPMTVENEIMELRARYTVASVSLSPEGSFAPLVIGSDLDGNCTASCVVRGLTESEYFFGMILDHTVILVDHDRLPFNFAAVSRHTMKYSITPMPYSRLTLVAKAMRECVTRRKG